MGKMERIFVVAESDNSCEFMGFFKNKKEAEKYWTQGDPALEKMVETSQVKFKTETEIQEEIASIVKAGWSGQWEIRRILSMASALNDAHAHDTVNRTNTCFFANMKVCNDCN